MFNFSVNLRGTAQSLYSLLYKFNFGFIIYKSFTVSLLHMNGDAFIKKKSNFGLYLLAGVIGPWRYWLIKRDANSNDAQWRKKLEIVL